MKKLSAEQSQLMKGYIMLVCTAFLWGGAFAFQKSASVLMDAFTFNFLRFACAVPALLLLCFLPRAFFSADGAREEESSEKSFYFSATFAGLGAGLFMFLGISLQQLGLVYTTAGKSGFLTAIYIIIVPMFAWFMGQRCRAELWVGAVLILGGVYLLSHIETGNAESDFNRGDFLTLLCAICWAAQVFWIGLFARHVNVLHLAIIQVSVVAFLSGVVMLVFGKGWPEWSSVWAVRYDVLYTGVVSTALAFTLQILGQRHVPASNAALIMSTEAVFAMLAGIVFLNEVLTEGVFWGCGLILLGIVLAQLQGQLFRMPSRSA